MDEESDAHARAVHPRKEANCRRCASAAESWYPWSTLSAGGRPPVPRAAVGATQRWGSPPWPSSIEPTCCIACSGALVRNPARRSSLRGGNSSLHAVAGGRFSLIFGIRESPPARGALFSSTSLKIASEAEFRGKFEAEQGQLASNCRQQLQTGLAARATGVSRSPAGLGRAGVAAGARRSVLEHKFENRVRG
jgi:hypothetical protein